MQNNIKDQIIETQELLIKEYEKNILMNTLAEKELKKQIHYLTLQPNKDLVISKQDDLIRELEHGKTQYTNEENIIKNKLKSLKNLYIKDPVIHEKLHNIVLIKTSSAENCILIPKYNKAEYHPKQYFTQMFLKDNGIQSFHLYVLSDEKLKIGDVAYITTKKEIGTVISISDPILGVRNITIQTPEFDHVSSENNFLKVIASTDQSLKLKLPDGSGHYTCPRPHDDFLMTFVIEYNKGNLIDKALVEYHEEFDPDKYGVNETGDDIEHRTNIVLNINSDNTINIHPQKFQWLRDEVLEVLKEFNMKFGTATSNDLHEWFNHKFR